MKKLYVKPSIEFEVIEASDILKSSWKEETNDFTDKKDGDGPNTFLEGGSSGEFAKSDFVFWEDEEESY